MAHEQESVRITIDFLSRNAKTRMVKTKSYRTALTELFLETRNDDITLVRLRIYQRSKGYITVHQDLYDDAKKALNEMYEYYYLYDDKQDD